MRGYTSAGGKLAFEASAESPVAYAHQLHHCQQLIDMGILSRVDVLRMGTTDLIGCMVEYQDPLKKKMGEIKARG